MDINKLLKNVNNVDEYISITQEISNKCKDTKVQINITTVLALKKFRSLEIEYLNKCYENGAACMLFERLLTQPPSKTWAVLAKELVGLLQYWLDAIRKYLINHCVHWWSFLKLILKFIKEIRLKDPSISNILVELTSECLFDIATQDMPDEYQRHEILHCLNVFCAESSREIRFAMRNKFGDYFARLARRLCAGGYLPAQGAALEALLRWLVPRGERARRAAAAARWLPPAACPPAAALLFVDRGWTNFFQDAREFLNALNEGNGLVTSVVCRRLTVGNILIISGSEKHQSWLDINSGGKSVSLVLAAGGGAARGGETLLICEHNTQTALLHTESQEVRVSVSTFQPPRLVPSDRAVGDENDVTIVVSSRVDLTKLDTALRGVFGDKYRVLMNLQTDLTLSPARARDAHTHATSSEDDSRFSHPVEVKRRKHSGYMVRSKHAGGLVSPSTASTSSLLQLHDKLAALPKYRYDKEPVSVCAQPQLSSVTEISERSFHSISTLKFRPFGVCYKNPRLSTQPTPNPNRKRSESDTETLKFKPKLGRRLSPVVSDDNSPSCLLVATVGSADDGVINDTIERLSKSKELQNDGIVDLLVQEALQAKPVIEDRIVDSGINSQDRKSQGNEENCEAIENTPVQNEVKDTSKRSRIARKKICTILSRSTTDESNTEVISDTPALVNSKITKHSRLQIVPEVHKETSDKQCFDVNTVEQFFSQHFGETKAGDIMISPTLAKKINETSSESSDTFDDQYLIINEDLNTDVDQFEFNNIEIVECLNDMIDKVCIEFEKCSEYLNKDIEIFGKIKDGKPFDEQAKVLQVNNPANVVLKQSDSVTKSKRMNKLTTKATTSKKEMKTRVIAKKRKNNIDKKPTAKMSTIVEQKDEEVLISSPLKEIIEDNELAKVKSPEMKKAKQSPVKNNMESPLLSRRKRKLYSPKDDEMKKENRETKDSDEEDNDVTLSEFKRTYTKIKKPKTTAACYKEIERERQKHIRLPRSRKSRGIVSPSSPRTLKNNAVFDKIKTTVESNEKIILADKKILQTDIYNYTSDSEDDDFRKKKIEIGKRISNTTVGSFESARPTRARRPRTRLNYSEKSSNDEVKKPKTVRRKKAVKKGKDNVSIEPVANLLDERMRDAGPEVLETSIILENPKETNVSEIELKIHEPQMESIVEDQKVAQNEKKKTSNKIKKTEELSSRKRDDSKLVADHEEDRTESPLPGLIVESMPNFNDGNDSVINASLRKFKKIYQEGFDPNNESTNTQNMLLSDAERCNYSPQNVSLSITEEICLLDCNKENKITKSTKENPVKHMEDKKKKKNMKLSNSGKITTTEKNNISKNDVDVIEIFEVPGVKSDISIATDGITAHGHLDEAPPSPDTIRRCMHPREIVDLNESMKDYFLKLNREINESSSKETRESNKVQHLEVCNKTGSAEIDKSSSVKSPVVSVLRLSFDNLKKWIPSRRTSDTSNYSKSTHTSFESVKVSRESASKSNIQKKTGQERNKMERPNIDSPKVKSPVVSIAKISLEEFNKWLPMPQSLESKDKPDTDVSLGKTKRQSSFKLVYNTRQKSKTLTDKKVLGMEKGNEINTRPKRITKKPLNLADTTDEDSDHVIDTVKTHRKIKNTKTVITKKRGGKIITKPDNDSDNSRPAAKKTISESGTKRSIERKTVISPIKSFEDFDPIYQNSESEEDMCVNKIRQKLSKDRATSKTAKEKTKPKYVEQDSPDSTSTKIKHVRSQDSIVRKLNYESSQSKSIVQLDLTSTKGESFKLPMKRKSSPVLGGTKKRFVDLDNLTNESRRSVSTVNDWLRRTEASRSRANDTSLVYRESMQSIIEKLDTTLCEMNQNTSKKFVNLFVEVQTQLNKQHEERRNRYKMAAADIVTAMVAVLDDKFVELDRRSQKMDTLFKEQLKEKAFDLIRDDCKQKRAMIALLKDEVQGALLHVERNEADLL